MKKVLICGISALALIFALFIAGCTSTNYLEIVTPHNAVELLSDNVRVFEGATYDEAAILAGEAGFEVILSYEGRNQQGPMGSTGSVRIIAKDADGIRSLAFAGYDKGKPSDTDTAVTVTTDNIAKKLAALPGTTPDSPATIKLASANISTAAWKQVHTAVKDAQQYVILDLSACSATDNTITGARDQNPSDADMNIIKDNQYIKAIILPKSLTSIGRSAFFGCKNLTDVTLPDSVTSIGDYAFTGCAITSVTIPNGVTSIGRSAFFGCKSLTNVTIPDGVTSIGQSAFEGCESLSSVSIPAGMTEIENRAFYHCTGLTSVTFGGSGTNFAITISFDGASSLQTAYRAGGAGTYTREAGGETWSKR
jgi:hypothetical protein